MLFKGTLPPKMPLLFRGPINVGITKMQDQIKLRANELAMSSNIGNIGEGIQRTVS